MMSCVMQPLFRSFLPPLPRRQQAAQQRAAQKQQQQQQQGGEEGAEDLVRESTTLRWEGHRMQGAHIELNLRFEDTVRKLRGRGDREARDVTLRLARELKRLNDGLVAKLARISTVNRTVVEILQKSQDGKAALMVRKAAEVLVKVRAPWYDPLFRPPS